MTVIVTKDKLGDVTKQNTPKIVFFNSLTGKKEIFRPLEESKVGLYTCGPTVYAYAHIGNFRAYVFEDVLRRYLEWSGFQVNHVMNFTDVDDKTIKGSLKQGLSLSAFTNSYVDAFLRDVDALGIKRAGVYCRATEHIPEMVVLINKLIAQDLAYKADDGSYYFRISAFPAYGKFLASEGISLKAGASGRVSTDEYQKENLADFALWKAWSVQDGGVYWDTELGRGRPGWHIECSAMSMKYLGETFDIHTGGVDNKFPHHENEIAQSEGATGKIFANYFLHCEHLLVDEKKMSKSLGNFYTLRDILNMGYSPRAIRYVLLSAHYRTTLNFTMKSVEAAEKTVKRLDECVERLMEIKEGKTSSKLDNVLIPKTRLALNAEMADDLNTPRALAVLHGFLTEVNKRLDTKIISKAFAEQLLIFMTQLNDLFNIVKSDTTEAGANNDISQLVLEREEARGRRDWKTADTLRDAISEAGYMIRDTPEGPKLIKN